MWQQTVDYFSVLIVNFLKLLTNNVTHNNGLSILLLTLIFRIVILPLTMKSLKSMKAMQALQPKIKELQAKYADDKERQTKEMMNLYKTAGANPMTGCLPMVLQIPIFIILFRVLRYPELNGYMLVNSSFFGMDMTTAAVTKLPATFLGGINLALPGMIDMTNPYISFVNNMYFYLPTTILVLLMVATTFLQQAGMTMDPKQKPTMYMMNLFIVYISLMMPSGVLLYWVFSNLFQIVQQKFFTKMDPAAEAVLAAATPKGKGAGGAKGKAVTATSGAAKPRALQGAPKSKSKKKYETAFSDDDDEEDVWAEIVGPVNPQPPPQTGTLKKDSAPKKPQSASNKSNKKKKR